MPYTYSDYPSHLKSYPLKIRHQWVNVFNNVLNKTNNEKRAFKAANSVLKKRINKKKEELSESQYFSYLIDNWLGKLEG
jgi:uncharacterized protein YdaT